MHALILQHVDLNPPGIWAEALDAAGVDVEIARPDRDGVPADLAQRDLVLALGGPQSACEGIAPAWLEHEVAAVADAVLAGVPFLGVCLGAQILARAAGGACVPAAAFELGLVDVRASARAALDPVLAPLGHQVRGFAFHGDACALPPGTSRLATSRTCAVEAFNWGPWAYGIQFHLEPAVADVECWLDYLPALAEHPSLVAAGGRDAFLDRYAAAVPALRDAAAGITRRWLATAPRRRARTLLAA